MNNDVRKIKAKLQTSATLHSENTWVKCLTNRQRYLQINSPGRFSYNTSMGLKILILST